MNNVKCKICGLKGHYNNTIITEFWASRFLEIHINKSKDWIYSKNIHYICRKCLVAILDSLKFESYRIEDLYKPQIKQNENRKN